MFHWQKLWHNRFKTTRTVDVELLFGLSPLKESCSVKVNDSSDAVWGVWKYWRNEGKSYVSYVFSEMMTDPFFFVVSMSRGTPGRTILHQLVADQRHFVSAVPSFTCENGWAWQKNDWISDLSTNQHCPKCRKANSKVMFLYITLHHLILSIS